MDWKEKVEAVKRIPIPKYMEEEVVPKLKGYYGSGEGTFAYKPVEKCPLHNEDTPSFRYYEETNSCSCFGCKRGGDVINLHRVFYETNENVEIAYKDAVNYLYSKFIEGRNDVQLASTKKANIKFEDGKAVVQSKVPDAMEAEAQKKDVMRLNRKIYDTEQRIMQGTGADAYTAAMTLDFLTKLYRVGAITAEELSNALG